MRRPRPRRLCARGALALAAACASSLPRGSLARAGDGAFADRLAAALNATSAKLAEVAAQPPFPSSLYASFAAAAERYPAALAPLQPLVDVMAAPPGPPLFSTVDATALVYRGPPAASQGAAAVEPLNVAQGTTSSSEGAQ